MLRLPLIKYFKTFVDAAFSFIADALHLQKLESVDD